MVSDSISAPAFECAQWTQLAPEIFFTAPSPTASFADGPSTRYSPSAARPLDSTVKDMAHAVESRRSSKSIGCAVAASVPNAPTWTRNWRRHLALRSLLVWERKYDPTQEHDGAAFRSRGHDLTDRSECPGVLLSAQPVACG